MSKIKTSQLKLAPKSARLKAPKPAQPLITEVYADLGNALANVLIHPHCAERIRTGIAQLYCDLHEEFGRLDMDVRCLFNSLAINATLQEKAAEMTDPA